MKRIKTYLFILVLVQILSILAITVSVDMVSAADLYSGYDPGAELKGAVRYKSFDNGGDREIYLGRHDLGVGSNRVETDAIWQSSNPVNFRYPYPADGKEETTVQASSSHYLVYPADPDTYDMGNLNYLQIDVVCREDGTTVCLNTAYFDSQLLGDFCCSYTLGDPNWNTWMVVNANMPSGFTITGDVDMSGTQPGGETNKVEIRVGYLSTNVRIVRTPPRHFSIIQAAYNTAVTTETIQCQDLPSGFDEDLNFADSKSVTLEGGYDADFTDNTDSYTTINGSLAVSDGTVIVENIIVQ